MMAFNKMNEEGENKEEIRHNLLKYCELDTFAMVKILEKLRKVVDVCGTRSCRVLKHHAVGVYVNSLFDSYKIFCNPLADGLVCVFKHENEWYLAKFDNTSHDKYDKVQTYECHIFKSDKEGELSSEIYLYEKGFSYDRDEIYKLVEQDNPEISEAAFKRYEEMKINDLLACIKEFTGEAES